MTTSSDCKHTQQLFEAGSLTCLCPVNTANSFTPVKSPPPQPIKSLRLDGALESKMPYLAEYIPSSLLQFPPISLLYIFIYRGYLLLGCQGCQDWRWVSVGCITCVLQIFHCCAKEIHKGSVSMNEASRVFGGSDIREMLYHLTSLHYKTIQFILTVF